MKILLNIVGFIPRYFRRWKQAFVAAEEADRAAEWARQAHDAKFDHYAREHSKPGDAERPDNFENSAR